MRFLFSLLAVLAIATLLLGGSGIEIGQASPNTSINPAISFGAAAVRTDSLTPAATPTQNPGTVWAWGSNDRGQLGDGTSTNRYSPVLVSGLTGMTGVATGWEHSVAMKSDGTVWGWGWNASGQLGDGTTTQRYTPVQATGITDVRAVAAGYYHTLAVKNDGTVWAWGLNSIGQLGDGTTTDRHSPVQVSELTNVRAVAGGYWFSLAVKWDGTVWAWGYNGYGNLGDGTTWWRSRPVQVLGLTDVRAVAAGMYHSLAVRLDGTLWAWGSNDMAQLGDGTKTDRHTPVQVAGLTGVMAMEGGNVHSLAVKNDGTVWAWGWNYRGQLGDGTTTQRIAPVQVSGLAGATAVAAGADHSLALDADGTVWAWGNNHVGQLGDGTTTQRNTPVQVSDLGGVSAIAAGQPHSLAVIGGMAIPRKVSGTVRYWSSGAPVPGVQLSLHGDQAYSAETNSSGAYSITNVLSDSYALTPSKSNGAYGITAYDASLVLRHVAGLITLTGTQAIAADVDKSGSMMAPDITAMDAYYILQKAVDSIGLPFPGAGVVWDFDPQDRSYTSLNADQPNEDFTALLSGDVSGNWSTGTSRAVIAEAQEPVTFTLVQGQVDATGLVTTTLELDAADAQIYGLNLALSYSPTAASVVSVEFGPLASGRARSVNLNQPGLVQIAAAGASPVSGSGDLLTLTFWMTEQGAAIPGLSVVRSDVNEGTIPTQVSYSGLDGWKLYLPFVME